MPTAIPPPAGRGSHQESTLGTRSRDGEGDRRGEAGRSPGRIAGEGPPDRRRRVGTLAQARDAGQAADRGPGRPCEEDRPRRRHPRRRARRPGPRARRAQGGPRQGPAGRARIAVLPYKGPNGTWRRPIVLECTNGTVTLRPNGPTFSMLDLSAMINPRSSPVILAIARELLRVQMSESPDGAPVVPYFVFLVRPDGIRPYYEARARLEPLGIAFGYELIEQDLKVDVPDFDNLATWDGTIPLEEPLLSSPGGGGAGPDSGDGLAWPAPRAAASATEEEGSARTAGSRGRRPARSGGRRSGRVPQRRERRRRHSRPVRLAHSPRARSGGRTGIFRTATVDRIRARRWAGSRSPARLAWLRHRAGRWRRHEPPLRGPETRRPLRRQARGVGPGPSGAAVVEGPGTTRENRTGTGSGTASDPPLERWPFPEPGSRRGWIGTPLGGRRRRRHSRGPFRLSQPTASSRQSARPAVGIRVGSRVGPSVRGRVARPARRTSRPGKGCRSYPNSSR